MSNLLNWIHWVVDLVEENDHDYRISAHLLELPTACIFCGTVGELHPYGTREQRFMDLPIHAKRTGILVGRRRFKCHSCSRTFIEPLADMDEDHRMTKRLLRFVQAESLRITFTEVAHQCGLDEKTVRLIFKEYTTELAKTYEFVTPTVLGIDELFLIGKPRCVLTNVEYRIVRTGNLKSRLRCPRSFTSLVTGLLTHMFSTLAPKMPSAFRPGLMPTSEYQFQPKGYGFLSTRMTTIQPLNPNSP